MWVVVRTKTYLHGILRSAKARVELLAPFPDRKQFHSILEDFTTEDPLDKFAKPLGLPTVDQTGVVWDVKAWMRKN